MTFACNIDPFNEAAWQITNPAQLYAEGFRGVRFTGRASIQNRITECVVAGLDVMAIITGESEGYVPWNAAWLQFHNEPDLHPTWPDNTPQKVADDYVLYRNTYAEHTINQGVRWAGPGLASGGVLALNWCAAWLEAIGDRAPWPDALALHPYTLTPTQARAQIDDFWNTFQIPVIVTEWWHTAASQYIWNFQCMLNGDGLDGQGARASWWNSYFAYTDAMVPGFGLRNGVGQPKAEYYSLLSSPCNGQQAFSEAPEADYQPAVLQMPGQIAGPFRAPPKGVILHGSRSGIADRPTHDEFMGTAQWAGRNSGGLSWSATIGNDEVALHLPMDAWGWNARAASDDYLAVEFAQPTVGDGISDAQVRAFCWFFEEARKHWKHLPAEFPTHAELDGRRTGAYDGKSDVFPKGDPRANELRGRIMARLREIGA